ncbi:MAG: PQQ-binding-like beta-propeller repeat protein [Bacteroidota bacterium]
MNRLVCIVLALTFYGTGYSQEPSVWRGPSGDGIYPESGLLQTWPATGPEILWSYGELGQGHSSAIVSNGYVYTSGMTDGKGFLFKFDLKGKLIYKKAYGPEFTESWYGTRGTPVIVGDKIYLESGHGKLVCFNEQDGEILWSKELFKDLDGSNIQWGVNETPVVDGNIIYATPGGKKNNVVALDRFTGNLIWTSPGKGELSAYCTPLLFIHKGRKILATHTTSHLIGLDAATGKLLWSHRHPNRYYIHPNTPIYHKGELFFFSGYGKGGGKLKLSEDGNSISKVWYNSMVDSRMGGAVLINGHIYVSGDSNREWRCIDWNSGKETYASSEIGKGAVIYADGMLYCYSERGELALVKADPSGFSVASKTKVTLGSEQHWAHPVIYDGVLYVRHGQALVSYKVK